MSRKFVRQSAAAFMGTPQVPGVGKVFPSPPKISRTSDAYENLPPGTPSGSVVYVEILRVEEKRVALGGPVAGTKANAYTLRFHLLFRSRQGDSEAAMDDHDDQVEAMLSRLREDRTLGTGGRLNQFGQDGTGITISTGMPKTSGTGSTHIWSVIDGTVLEFIDA